MREITQAARLSGLVAVFTLLLASAAVAGEWPTWRGPWQNGRSDEKSVITDWSKENQTRHA